MKLKKSDQQQLWAEAQRRCRLSDEAVRMAKELGIRLRSSIKNIPARTQRWKARLEDRIRDRYEQRQREAIRKTRREWSSCRPARSWPALDWVTVFTSADGGA